MGKFQHGDFVKHKASEVHVFQVLHELESVPPGRPSLYRCMSLDDEEQLVGSGFQDDKFTTRGVRLPR